MQQKSWERRTNVISGIGTKFGSRNDQQNMTSKEYLAKASFEALFEAALD